MTNMLLTPLRLGLIYCLAFVTLQAFQAVFLGSLFQQVDSFRVGAWVFGLSFIGCTLISAIVQPAQLRKALRSWSILIPINVCVALTWCCYFQAVQLIEPAIVFTIFSGMVPLGALLAAHLGLVKVRSSQGRYEKIGHGLIIAAIVILTGVTLSGHSGFVRGDWTSALAGVTLSAISGCATAFVILLSVRWHEQGVGPAVQFGLRFCLYTLVAMMASYLGLDAKPEVSGSPPFAYIVVIGMLVVALPLYLMQQAVPLVSGQRIAGVMALGPGLVFVMQLLDGRIGYATGTLAGLAVYLAGALIAVFGINTEEGAARSHLTESVLALSACGESCLQKHEAVSGTGSRIGSGIGSRTGSQDARL